MVDRCIDLFNHFLPASFFEKITELGGKAHMLVRASRIPAMSDLDYRIRLMDTIEGYQQIPCVVSPNVELLVPPERTSELARFANEEFRSICDRYPDKFPSFIAVIPLDSSEKAIKEAEYAIKGLGAAGVQIFTNNNGRAIDSPEYMALYEELNKLNTTLWIHPNRTFKEPFYKGEELEKYELWWTLMWPIETSMAAARLIYSGFFQKFTNLNVILHHAGALLPMLGGRFDNGLQLYSTRTAHEYQYLTDTPVSGLDQGKEFRKFYADCATFGSRSAIRCAIDFFGIEKIVFASDMPFDPEDGFGYVRMGIRDVSNLDISDEDKKKIFYGNALKLLPSIK